MSYGTPDVYYNPEVFGLNPVAEIDYSDGCYQFDYRVVWRSDDDGTLYTARDSGCSCPSPFEDFTKLEDLDVLDYDALKREVDEELRGYGCISATETQDFLRKVREAA